MAKKRRSYPQKVKDACVSDFESGLGYGTVAQKHKVPKSAVRSFVKASEVSTAGRADLLGKQHKPRKAERLIVSQAKSGDKARKIANSFKLPFRTAVAAAWRFGNPWPTGYNPL